jgi:hypothetical protein
MMACNSTADAPSCAQTTSDAGSLSYDEPSDVGTSYQQHNQQDAAGSASSEDRAMLFEILQRALVEKEEALRRVSCWSSGGSSGGLVALADCRDTVAIGLPACASGTTTMCSALTSHDTP